MQMILSEHQRYFFKRYIILDADVLRSKQAVKIQVSVYNWKLQTCVRQKMLSYIFIVLKTSYLLPVSVFQLEIALPQL